MFSLFSFGKKSGSKKSSKRPSKNSKKVSKKGSKKSGTKPPAKLLSICKRLKVKTTMKRGTKRVYRPVSVLVKVCKKKVKVAKAKRMAKFGFGSGGCSRLVQFGKKNSKKGSKKGSKKSSKKGSKKSSTKIPAKLRSMCKKLKVKTTMKRGSKRVYRPVSVLVKLCKKKLKVTKAKRMPKFGKKSKSNKKVSKSTPGKVAAMRAFKKFYTTHCKPTLRRSARFGFGLGNPSTNAMMGHDFCPNGGGVLESTGLFASPCRGPTGGVASFGAKSRKPRAVYRKPKCAGLKRKVCYTNPSCRYIKKRGCRARKGAMVKGKGRKIFSGPMGMPEGFVEPSPEVMAAAFGYRRRY